MNEMLQMVVAGRHLSESQARELLASMTGGEMNETVAAACLVALRMKGEHSDEVRGFALGLRELATRPNTPPDARAIDIVGTGGDKSGSLNLSTGSALLTAAAGQPVIKHGNRSVSSRSGSADVLEALGMPMPLGPEEAGDLFDRTGFTFLFAPAYHPAMKSIAPVRSALGIRTIFNIAGPLANPATPPLHVIGAYSIEMAEVMADTLAGMPIERAFVVHGDPGWDEPTPVGPYVLFDVTPGKVTRTVENPADFGIEPCSPEDLAGGDAVYNSTQLRKALGGEPGSHLEALVLGAALALRVAGVAPEEAIESLRDTVSSGAAALLVDQIGAAA